jgi:hypothetical protein
VGRGTPTNKENVVERQKMVMDEDGEWRTAYVDCGEGRVSPSGRPASVYGRKRSDTSITESMVVTAEASEWTAIHDDHNPTADEAIARVDREIAWREFSAVA